jgi:FHS family L-fucose permease-like MFS transporter
LGSLPLAVIAPATLSLLIPATAVTLSAKLPYIERLFVVLGSVLAGVALVTLAIKEMDVSSGFQSTPESARHTGGLLRQPRAVMGFVAISLILGVEAGLFGLYRNYLEDPGIAGVPARQSQQMFTLYFALFALGRLAASWVQTRIRLSTHVIVHLVAAVVCLVVAVTAKGVAAIVAVTAVGFFVSILFPTLYSIAIQNMGEMTGQVSGLLTMGFIGCAVIPVFEGWLADTIGLQHSYAIGLFAYIFAAFFTLRIRGRNT